MTTIVIYHDKCTDGLGALFSVLHAHAAIHDPLGNGFELHPGKYGDTPPDVDGKDVIIVDFSYSREVMEDLISRARSLICLDHHKSAQDALAGLPGCIFDMEQSGAGLAWRHFHPGERVPDIIQYIEDRDIWRKALPQTEEVNSYINSCLDFGKPVEANLVTLRSLMFLKAAEMADRGEPVRKANLAHVESTASMWFYVTLCDGTRLPAVLAGVKVASEVGNLLCAEDPLQTSLVLTSGGNGKFGMSFRSTNGGALRLAQLYGGGGHLNAAGAGILPADLGVLLATREERP